MTAVSCTRLRLPIPKFRWAQKRMLLRHGESGTQIIYQTGLRDEPVRASAQSYPTVLRSLRQLLDRSLFQLRMEHPARKA